MIKLTNIRMPLDYTDKMLADYVCKHLRINDYKGISVLKRSTIIDNKDDIHYKITASVMLENEQDEKHIAFIRRNKGASFAENYRYDTIPAKPEKRPVVVGFGPAGIFASLILAESGAMPIILERGTDVDTRFNDINLFQNAGKLNEESNIQFGEGGAGAFSDGKLKPGLIDNRKYKILSELVKAGANESILYLEKPHIGSDVLRTAVKNIRQKIISLGGEIRFSAKATKLNIKDSKVIGIGYLQNGGYNEIECDSVLLAIGHSARDTFEYLYENGVKMEQKGFGVGLRIEHPQEYINRLQYGKECSNPLLGAADYKLVTHLKNGRSVYSFCMCPGGYVVPAASEKGSVCTNGMSEAKRDSVNANSALLVSVTPDDFESEHPLAGFAFQRTIEGSAFNCAGENYNAPVQRVEDFIKDRQTEKFGEVMPTYKPGTAFVKHSDYMPRFICDSLKQSITDFDDWMPGFYYPDALLTGPEMRSTSPVRLLRNNNLEAIGIDGLYPCGEGAGYAGGIISAAYDGILCAEQILKK